MPEELRIKDNPVAAYRNYYKTKGFARWEKNVACPAWWG
jgi:hypothetical protein